VDEKGVIIVHTFVPGVPGVYDHTLTGLGNFSEVTAGMLAGQAGYVHVGMDKDYIALQVQTAIGKEVYLLSIILIVSVLVSFGLIYLVSRQLDQLRNYALHSLSSEQHASPPDPSQIKRLLERTDEVGELGGIPLGFRPAGMSTHARERVTNRWLIATMCTVLQLCLGTVYAWSYFQPLLVEQFRWTNTETSWAFSLTICCLGLSAAWGGINLARIGPRKIAVVGGLLFAAGYALAALALAVKSLTLFYLGYGAVAGIGIGLGYVTPMSTVALQRRVASACQGSLGSRRPAMRSMPEPACALALPTPRRIARPGRCRRRTRPPPAAFSRGPHGSDCGVRG
jgi:hypothetical protein